MIASLQSSIGVLFREDTLVLVHLKKLLHEVVLAYHEEVSLQTDRSADERKEFCAGVLSRFMKDHNLGQENVWVSIPRSEVLVRFLTLPATAEENLREVIRYELGRYFPFAEEDILFDFLVLGRNGEAKKIRILLLAIEKTVLEKYLVIIRQAGITARGIEMSTNSLLNFYLLGKNGADNENPTALVEVGESGLELSWVCKGTLCYSRAVAFDGEDDTEQSLGLLRELHTSFREAFPLRTWEGGEEESPVQLYLAGQGRAEALLPKVAESARAMVSILPCEPMAVRLGFSQPIPAVLAGTVGAALRGIQKVPWEVNLLPAELRKKTSKVGLYLNLALVFLVVFLSLGWVGSAIVKERLELRSIEKNIGALRGEVTEVLKVQKEAQALAAKMEGLDKIRESQFSAIEILRELSSLLPSEAWLTDLRCYRNEVNISGFAQSASDLIATIDGSPLFVSSAFTAPITRDLDGKERFKIKTTIEKNERMPKQVDR